MTGPGAQATCPHCGFPRGPEATECPRCGVVFAKYAARQRLEAQRAPHSVEPAPVPPRRRPTVTPTALPRGRRTRRLSPAVARDLYGSLAALSDSGTPLAPALEALAARAAGPARQALQALGAGLRQGATLGDAMGSAGAWSPGEVELVRAGERVGRVGDSLRDLAALAERRVVARRQLRKRLAYPALVLVSWCILDPIGQLITVGAGTYAAVVAVRLGALAGVSVALLWGVPRLARYEPVRRRLGVLLWRAPWPASVSRARARGRLLRVLGRAVASGLGAREALEIAGSAAEAPGTPGRAAQAATALAGGATLTDALAGQGLLDATGRLVLTAAEHAGTLDEGLATLADRYEEVADRGAQTVIRVLGATLTLVVLLGVALSILGALGNATSGTDELLRQLDKEVPFDLHGTGLDQMNPGDLQQLREVLPRGM